MSRGVEVYGVDHVLWGSLGSHSGEQLSLASSDSAAEAISQAVPERAGIDRRAVAREALRHLILGEPFEPQLADVYALWMRECARALGDFYPNDAWMPLDMGFVKTVQRTLDAAGVSPAELSLESLMFGGVPVGLPPTVDIGIGFTSKVDVGDRLAVLGRADLSGVSDKNVRDAIEQLALWFEKAASSKRDLLCFYV